MNHWVLLRILSYGLVALQKKQKHKAGLRVMQGKSFVQCMHLTRRSSLPAYGGRLS